MPRSRIPGLPRREPRRVVLLRVGIVMIEYCCPTCGRGAYGISDNDGWLPPSLCNDERRGVMFCTYCDSEITAESVVPQGSIPELTFNDDGYLRNPGQGWSKWCSGQYALAHPTHTRLTHPDHTGVAYNEALRKERENA